MINFDEAALYKMHLKLLLSFLGKTVRLMSTIVWNSTCNNITVKGFS